MTTSRVFQRLPHPFDSPFVWSIAERWVLPIWFAAWTFQEVRYLLSQPDGLVGVDARIYYRAAQALLAGGNPWAAEANGFVFAAPPPTLIPYVPFTLLREDVFVVLAVAASVLVAMALIRTFRLPWYWLFFPPLVEGVWVANPNPLVVLLLVRGLTGGAVLAVMLKLYAVIPLIGEMRLRAVVLSVGCLILTLPILPWGLYQGQSSHLSEILLDQSQGGRSALSLPFLVPFALLALISLDRRTAGWLAVPALWPATQLHYSLLALPVMHPILAIFFCVPAPGFQAMGVIAYTVWLYLGGGPHRTPVWRYRRAPSEAAIDYQVMAVVALRIAARRNRARRNRRSRIERGTAFLWAQRRG